MSGRLIRTVIVTAAAVGPGTARRGRQPEPVRSRGIRARPSWDRTDQRLCSTTTGISRVVFFVYAS